MSELKLKELEEMTPHTIFKRGVIQNPEIYEGKPIRWLAKKGTVTDWVIYYHDAEHDESYVKAHGYKLVERPQIENLVPCTDEVYKKYRY